MDCGGGDKVRLAAAFKLQFFQNSGTLLRVAGLLGCYLGAAERGVIQVQKTCAPPLPRCAMGLERHLCQLGSGQMPNQYIELFLTSLLTELQDQ